MQTTAKQNGRRRKAENALPIVALGLAGLLCLAVLPSVLRPPPDQASTSAELSPDAPPDDQQESIISALNRGATATAGDATEGLPGAETTAQQTPLAIRAPETAPRACKQGFGDPPRQAESLYSPPCALAFTGDNGGATWKGVSASEVRIGILPHPLAGWGHQATEGPVKTEASASENAVDRTLRVLQAYFNENYQLYGRQIRLLVAKQGQTEPEMRAAAVRAATEYGVFGVDVIGGTAHEEAIRRELVTFGTTGNSAEFYAKASPYAYAFQMDGDKLVDFYAELVCKQLAGRPPSFNEQREASFDYSKPRRFGLLAFDDETHTGYKERLDAKLAKCGERLTSTSTFNITYNRQAMAGAVTRMRADGVTTILCGCDVVSPAIFTNEATAQGYFPEWVTGSAGTDSNGSARGIYDPDQWRHALGIGPLEISRADEDQSWFRAYKSVDVANDPHAATASGIFDDLGQLVGGLQLAGPRLTPTTFREGLFKLPRRTPNPAWSIGGGYGAGDLTYADYVSLIWWDPTARAPDAPNVPGAYRHLLDARRFALGEIPSEQLAWFREGLSSV